MPGIICFHDIYWQNQRSREYQEVLAEAKNEAAHLRSRVTSTPSITAKLTGKTGKKKSNQKSAETLAIKQS